MRSNDGSVLIQWLSIIQFTRVLETENSGQLNLYFYHNLPTHRCVIDLRHDNWYTAIRQMGTISKLKFAMVHWVILPNFWSNKSGKENNCNGSLVKNLGI